MFCFAPHLDFSFTIRSEFEVKLYFVSICRLSSPLSARFRRSVAMRLCSFLWSLKLSLDSHNSSSSSNLMLASLACLRAKSSKPSLWSSSKAHLRLKLTWLRLHSALTSSRAQRQLGPIRSSERQNNKLNCRVCYLDRCDETSEMQSETPSILKSL